MKQLVANIVYWDDDHRRRAMKSFTSFLVEMQGIINDGKFICGECSGRGSMIPDDEYADPVEGYKFARRINCPTCNGSKYVTEKFWRDYFKQEKAKWSEREAERKHTELIRKQALKKLTKEEREVLGL